MTAFLPSAEVERIRATVELRSNSGAATVWPGFQTANEEQSPDAATQLANPSYISSNGITYGASFEDISAALASKQLVRFGLFVLNGTGTNTEVVLASLRVEVQSRS